MQSSKPATARKLSKADHASQVSNEARLHWLFPVFVALLTCAAFFPALSNDFVNWDDDRILTNNPLYRGLGWEHLKWMFTTFHMGHYQPLSWVTFAIDYLIWGMDPFGYHLTNLLIHAASAVLFYFVSRRLLSAALAIPDGQSTLQLNASAALAALFFAIHPLRVESVAWATERRDVLSGLFFFGTIYCYLHARPDKGWCRWMSAALALYGLSLLSKATAMTLPVVLLLLDVYPLRRFRLEWPLKFNAAARDILSEKVPFFILALLFAAVALLAQHSAGALRPMQQYFASYRLGQAFYGLSFYLWKTLAPLSLSPIYELPYDFDAWMPLFLACGTAIITVSLVLWSLRQRWPVLLACWVYYLVVAAPLLGVAQSGMQLVADRYSYLSCLSWALLCGGVFYQLCNPMPARASRSVRLAASSIMVSALLVTYGYLSWTQTQVWRTPTTLWKHAIAAAPESSIACYNMAHILEHQGSLPQSMEFYRRALTINPTYAEAHYNLARLLAKDGQQVEAIYHYRQALQLAPGDAETLNNLGLLLAVRGEIDESLAHLRRAIRANPNYAKAFFNMGRIFAGQGNFAEAIRNHRQALKLNPNEVEIHIGLGNALAGQGDMQQAVKHFQAAIALKPELPEAHVALARLMAMQGNRDEATQHYHQAQRILRAQSGR